MEKFIGRHVFIFNPKDNGGESLSLVTEFFDNGDGPKAGIYTNQRLSLQSYCNSAEFQLMGAVLTPDNLRKLANELESAEIKAVASIKENTPQVHYQRTLIVDEEEELTKATREMIQMCEFIYVRKTGKIIKDRYGSQAIPKKEKATSV